jgi:two-component system cell cycle sensor histidine kinase/response regulator CckA
MEQEPAARPLRVLHLEDNESDAAIVKQFLKTEKVDCVVTLVSTREQFLAHLGSEEYDLILADQTLPGFGGTAALEIARHELPDVPFIFVTGSMDEDLAIETFKQGATDYVLKSRLKRLSPSIRRAVQEAGQRRAYNLAKAQLQESEARFSAFVDNSPTVVYMKDIAGRYAYINKTFERVFNIAATTLLHKTDLEWLPEAAARAVMANDQTTLVTGNDQEFLENVPTSDGASHQWLSFKFRFLNTRGEKFLGGVSIDVTEKANLESQFLRAQRMESIGVLAGGIAHDLNNVLSPILMVSQLLKMKHEDEETVQFLDTLETSAQRGADLIKQVLTFARGAEGEKIELQPSHLIADIQKMLHETLPRTIEMRVKLPKDLWNIKGIATQVNQIVLNLCVNARDAMPEGGRIEIAAENVSIGDNYSLLHPEARSGPYVVIAVSDEGTGIPASIIEKIYDPFFTTKDIGKGTGLGLSTVKGIVKSHDGFIHVYSEVGKGTTFKVYLPAVPRGTQSPVESRNTAIPRGHGELILVVDDEAAVRQTLKVTLEKFGYGVLSATDGVDGLTAFVQNMDKVSVVLTDMAMPHLEGTAMIRAILKIAPNAKIIAISGHFDERKIENLREQGTIKRLEKPFLPEQLLGAIAEVLEVKA